MSTVSATLESVLCQIDDSFEVVVVDNHSTDGTLEYLQRLQDEGKLRLIVRNCTRGNGRQIAFEHSEGDYILDQLDLDDVYKPSIKKVIELYHAEFEGSILLLRGLLVAPRERITQVGGWHDLQWGEDFEFWFRASKLGMLRYLHYETRSSVKVHGSGRLMHRLRYRYERARDLFRVGLSPFSKPGTTVSKALSLPLYTAGFLASKVDRRYVDPEIKKFQVIDYSVSGETIHKYGLP